MSVSPRRSASSRARPAQLDRLVRPRPVHASCAPSSRRPSRARVPAGASSRRRPPCGPSAPTPPFRPGHAEDRESQRSALAFLEPVAEFATALERFLDRRGRRIVLVGDVALARAALEQLRALSGASRSPNRSARAYCAAASRCAPGRRRGGGRRCVVQHRVGVAGRLGVVGEAGEIGPTDRWIGERR